jgi:putative ABC transport system permease protein
MLFTIAIRNILRNGRRSLATVLAIAVGAIALLVFGAFRLDVFQGLETNAVQHGGHLTVFRRGYFLFGQGKPDEYGISGYQTVMGIFKNDPRLKKLISIETPLLSFNGIAGNFQGGSDASKTFIGVGLIPSDREKMRQWNEYGADRSYVSDNRMTDGDISKGLIGAGLARMLDLCGALVVPNCPAAPKASVTVANIKTALPPGIAELAQQTAGHNAHAAANPRIDLLAATSGGAPNVVSLDVSGVDPQSVKELDDNYLAMNLRLAQRLVYGRGAPEVTGIAIQLHRSEDLLQARTRLTDLIAQNHLDLEVRDFGELNPFYVQVKQFFSALFLFMTIIMGVIVLFAVANTMAMAVMERTGEIGTVRAMGVRRSGIRWQFLLEGAMLGVLGATIGVIAAFVISSAINRSGIHWSPPGNSGAVPLHLAFLSGWRLMVFAWITLVGVAALASLAPANRAAKLEVVEALRHA